MESLFPFGDISAVIQLAVAPVFLLASISGALNVLSLRMGRIIDRGRRLNEMQLAENSPEAAEVDREQQSLASRARLINRAIALCTVSALFICMVIVVLFLDALYTLALDRVIAALFIIALLSLIMALVTFLREIGHSVAAFRFGPYRVTDRR
jgi:hypothetical protein